MGVPVGLTAPLEKKEPLMTLKIVLGEWVRAGDRLTIREDGKFWRAGAGERTDLVAPTTLEAGVAYVKVRRR